MKLAERGYSLAECQIGYFYYTGIGTDKSIDKALYWTERALAHGDPDAAEGLNEIGRLTMKLESERLELIPLTARQLRLRLEDIDALESELGFRYRGKPASGFFIEFVHIQAAKARLNPDYYLYHTLWFLLRKADKTVLGEIAFTGAPDENHEVEISYGLSPEFEGNGYMTEAVRTLCDWALDQDEVAHIIAKTEDNPKSDNTLRRSGFEIYKEDENTLWWRK